MSTEETLAVVRAYHEAWTSKNINEAARHLADDLEFEGAINRCTTAERFVTLLRAFVPSVVRVDLLAEFGHEDEAMLLYDAVTDAFGTMRTAEYFIVKDGKIRRFWQVYDATKLRTAERDAQGVLRSKTP